MSDDTFPGSVCEVMLSAATTWEDYPRNTAGSLQFHARPLRPTDGEGAVGIYPADWMPGDFEIGAQEPTLQRYTLYVENMTKGANTPEIRALHSRRAKVLRAMLYRDTDLRVALHALREVLGEVTEKFGRFGVTNQRFFTREVSGTFLHLAQTEVWVETNS